MTIKLINDDDSKTYVFNTINTFDRAKNYNIIVANLPTGDTDNSVINALLGVEQTISISFEITPRASGDDYTDSTGTAVANSIDDEANWLYDTVCAGSSKSYRLTRSRDSQSWTGTLADISIPEVGDQPNKFICRIIFKEGVVP